MSPERDLSAADGPISPVTVAVVVVGSIVVDADVTPAIEGAAACNVVSTWLPKGSAWHDSDFEVEGVDDPAARAARTARANLSAVDDEGAISCPNVISSPAASVDAAGAFPDKYVSLVVWRSKFANPDDFPSILRV